VCVCVCLHACIYKFIHTYICMCVCVYTHTHTYTHTCLRPTSSQRLQPLPNRPLGAPRIHLQAALRLEIQDWGASCHHTPHQRSCNCSIAIDRAPHPRHGRWRQHFRPRLCNRLPRFLVPPLLLARASLSPPLAPSSSSPSSPCAIACSPLRPSPLHPPPRLTPDRRPALTLPS
jgi:hypothetical protein